jgi:hypothetical protein
MTDQILFDAILPKNMAIKAEALGVKKSQPGGFISMSAIFATTVAAGSMPIKDKYHWRRHHGWNELLVRVHPQD